MAILELQAKGDLHTKTLADFVHANGQNRLKNFIGALPPLRDKGNRGSGGALRPHHPLALIRFPLHPHIRHGAEGQETCPSYQSKQVEL